MMLACAVRLPVYMAGVQMHCQLPTTSTGKLATGMGSWRNVMNIPNFECHGHQLKSCFAAHLDPFDYCNYGPNFNI